eukprot:10552171-Alexandrium_andersonii.AAC.1
MRRKNSAPDRKANTVVRFAWADSSPQTHRDWLVLRQKMVLRKRLLGVWRAARKLDGDSEHRARRRWCGALA